MAGASQALELHMVHKAADGTLAVLGTFFEVGAANGALDQVFSNMATASDVPAALPSTLDPTLLLPTDNSGWIYDGSLTTPPYTAGVKWNLYAGVQEVSAAQLALFTHDPSFRPTQALGSRLVTGGD